MQEVRTVKENWESGRIETVTASRGIHLGPGKRGSPFDSVYAVQKLRGKDENLDVANVLRDGESQFIMTHLKWRSMSGASIASLNNYWTLVQCQKRAPKNKGRRCCN